MNSLSASSQSDASLAHANGNGYDFDRGSGGETPEFLAALWRYRWAVILPGVLGAVVGFLVYLRTPETYRSSTQLIIESDRAAMLDSMTGELVGAVPDIEIVRSQLFSDDVLKRAYTDPRMRAFDPLFAEGMRDFGELVLADRALKLEPQVTDLKAASSLVTLLHFDSTNEELSETAVAVFSDALQAFYNNKHKSSRSELLQYMERITKEAYPQLKKMEDRYQEFRTEAPLAWDGEGTVLNPHRERQLFLRQRQSELTEKLRELTTEHQAVKAVVESSEDPEVALAVVGQLLNKRFSLADDLKMQRTTLGQDDEQLAMTRVEERLVPMIVEKNRFISEYGPEHPKVKQLDQQIKLMKEELGRVMSQQANRIGELLQDSDRKAKEAGEALEAIQNGLNAQIAMWKSQIEALGQQIEDERSEASKLAEYELRHESMLREMEQQRELIDQLEQQMARVKLSEEESGTQVSPLKAPSTAKLISPVLIKNLAIGTFLGLAFGGGLAFLLEKNANTFRDPDEISQTLGVPVLTHVPFFKGRAKRPRKGEANPFKDLDASLTVVHTPASVASEAIRSLRTSVFFETTGPGGKVIQVTSPLPGDGKSTIAGNLACSIAQSGKKVLVVDCDLRRPQLTDNFCRVDANGLTNVLNGECDPGDAIHPTPVHQLEVMPSGPIPANPADALTLPEMGELLELLRERYDYVIMDTPPMLVVTDPSITANLTDGVVVAIRVRRKSKPNAKESMSILRAVGSRVLGVVINNSDESSSSDGYQGYGYYRYGRYTNRYYRRNEPSKTSVSANGNGRKHASPVIVSGKGFAAMRQPESEAVGGTPGNRLPAADDRNES